MCRVFFFLLFFPQLAWSLGAHEHGHVSFEMAIDGMQAAVELRGPAESFVGFEHKPKTKTEKKAVRDAQKVLKQQALPLLGFSADLECTLSDFVFDMIHESNHKHDHDHGHGDKHKGEHSEIKVTYKFSCKKMVQATKLELGLTKSFSNIKNISVAILPSSGNAFAVELKSGENSISIP